MYMKTIPFPEINATLNGLAFICLNIGFYQIKNRNFAAHKKAMLSAFIFSVIFLVSYLTYHFTREVMTPFSGTGIWKPIYYSILISHIILAMGILPLIIRTMYFSLTDQLARHKKIARITFPIWYYVSITGVIVYFFLYQWFPPVSTL